VHGEPTIGYFYNSIITGVTIFLVAITSMTSFTMVQEMENAIMGFVAHIRRIVFVQMIQDTSGYVRCLTLPQKFVKIFDRSCHDYCLLMSSSWSLLNLLGT
jgi:hypothetical protein